MAEYDVLRGQIAAYEANIREFQSLQSLKKSDTRVRAKSKKRTSKR
jgi:hypothetical protein